MDQEALRLVNFFHEEDFVILRAICGLLVLTQGFVDCGLVFEGTRRQNAISKSLLLVFESFLVDGADALQFSEIDDLHEVLLNQVDEIIDAFDLLEFFFRDDDIEEYLLVLLDVLDFACFVGAEFGAGTVELLEFLQEMMEE